MPEKGDVTDWIKAGGTKDELLKLCAEAPEFVDLVLDPGDPMRSARALVETEFTDDDGLRFLHRWRGIFWDWSGSCYRIAEDETVRSKVWRFLDGAYVSVSVGTKADPKFELHPFKPNRNKAGDVKAALEAITQLNLDDAPAWIAGRDQPPAHEFMALGNGLLHLPTSTPRPPTPALFNIVASEVLFDPVAPEPVAWFEFLDQILVDTESIAALQDWSGYCLAPDTTQQKILLCVGPRRSGKGTVARVLTGLLGKASVAGPTMNSLGGVFGLEPLITRALAVVSDMRVGKRTDTATITERLLSISGEDTLTVDRKYKDSWHGRLMTRLMILTNDLPALSDSSGALAGRYVCLLFPNSFYGKEDSALGGRLLDELPGILNWALVGSQVFLESISEDGQLAIGLEATEGFLGLQQAGGGPSERLRPTVPLKPS